MTTCTYSSESVGLNTPGLEEVVVSNATCPRSNTDSTVVEIVQNRFFMQAE